MRKIYILKAFCLFFPLVSHAQEVVSDRMLSDVVIRENRLELPFSDQSRSIQTLTRARLAALPVHTVAEALQSVCGIDIRQRGPFGVQADLHVRGGGFDQALVLINGIRLSDPQTGHHLLNLPVDWNSIERIEVLKGPGARIYGQNAFACAINIVTNVPPSRLFRVGFAGGDFGYLHAEAGLAIPIKNYRQNLSFSGDWSDGYRYNTDFSVLNFAYESAWKDKKEGEWNLIAGFNQRKFGANGYYGRLEFKDQYEEVQTNLVGLSYRRQKGAWLLKPRLYWRRNQDWYAFVRNNPPAFQNFHLSQVVGAEGNAARQSRWGVTGIGVGAEYTALHSSRLGQRERTTFNLFAEHRFSLLNRRLDLTPGVSFSYFSDFGPFVYPGLDAGFRLGSNWKVFANAGYNYRIPTFTDLYYEDAGNKGNPDLKPERALALETGLKYEASGVLLQAALFRRDGDNLIDYSKENQADKWQANNFNAVLMQGVELNAEVSFAAFWGEKTWLQHLRAGYTYIDAATSNQVAFSRYTLNNLRHQFVAGIEHRLFGPVRHSFRLRWCDRLSSDASVKSDYTVADAKLSAQFKRFQIFAEATNVFDAVYGELRYNPTAVLTMPGRWFRAGAVFRK